MYAYAGHAQCKVEKVVYDMLCIKTEPDVTMAYGTAP